MIPMVENADEARAIVEAVRYPPEGRRGAAFGFAHDGYGEATPHQTIEHANARNLVIAQIETERGLEAVEDIAAVNGIDVLWVGHFDLTNFLGIPGEFKNPVYLDALKRIVSAGRSNGKGLGFLPSDPVSANEYKGYGFNMLAAGTDHAMVRAGVKAVLDSVRD